MRLRLVFPLVLVITLALSNSALALIITGSATLTGDQAPHGIGMLNGSKLAIEHAKAKGDILTGYTLEHVALDDARNTAIAPMSSGVCQRASGATFLIFSSAHSS